MDITSAVRAKPAPVRFNVGTQRSFSAVAREFEGQRRISTALASREA
jgi:hypothetical protein